MSCLSRHAHTPQESLASQGLGDGVMVRGLGRMNPQPMLARACLQEAGVLSRWRHHSWNVQLQPGGLLALQAACAVPAGLAHGSRCSKAGLRVAKRGGRVGGERCLKVPWAQTQEKGKAVITQQGGQDRATDVLCAQHCRTQSVPALFILTDIAVHILGPQTT